MNGSTSPDPAASAVVAGDAPSAPNGHDHPSHSPTEPESVTDRALPRTQEDGVGEAAIEHDADIDADDGASEAETLITSPVKKREAAKRNAVVKTEKPLRSRIGGLPVPGDDDESSVASPMPSTEVSVGKAASSGDAVGDDSNHTRTRPSLESEDDNDSALTSARSSVSRASTRSRAASERPGRSKREPSLNPRKRKYRASSVGLPDSKRRSIEPPRATRRSRGPHTDDQPPSAERSPSPRLRSHRRAVSMQSAQETAGDGSGRKRRPATQAPVREPKSTNAEWAESDVSSETTSRAGDDSKRPSRQIGRSTSNPGRPSQREQKRHVNKYGFTRLAEACESGDMDAVREWRVKDPDQVELAEFAGNKPLQIAALNGNSEVVAYLIHEGCHIDCANVDKDTPLIDAAENGHLEVVKLLLDAGVDPLRQNMKGQQALDVVTDDIDDAKAIRAALREAIDRWNSDDAKQRREEEEIQRHRGGPSKELHFMARTYENLLKLVTINDRGGVQEFLDARVPVDNAIIAAAAKTGDSYLLSMLLAEMTEKKAYQKPEKPMLAVLGTSHFEMVKLLTELDQFNPLWQSRQDKTWPEIAEERNGPMWRQEKDLLQRLYDQHVDSKQRRSSSPVSKRDANGKRRRLHRHSGEDSDDGDSAGPKRKNGRRLMSRRDMRAAGGPGVSGSSDGDDDDDSSEDDARVDATDDAAILNRASSAMHPPDTPSARRAAGRTRSKSSTSQQSDTSPQTRRRSVSLRGEHALATVEERSEDVDAKAAVPTPDREGEIKTRKAEDEARANQHRRQAEEQRKADEQLRLEEEQRAEEMRLQEEARCADEARTREEERAREQQKLDEAKQQARSKVLAGLPLAVHDVLDPDSPFTFDEAAAEDYASFLVRHFTPLRPVSAKANNGNGAPGIGPRDWVLNLQAAPLLGKRGFELFLPPDAVGFEGCLADRLDTVSLEEKDRYVVDQVLSTLPAKASLPDEDGFVSDADGQEGHLSPHRQRQLQRCVERYNAYVSARRRLEDRDQSLVLRCVRLDDVLRHLHPVLRNRDIEVARLFTEPAKKGQESKRGATDGQDFVARMQVFWDDRRARCLYNGLDGDAEDETVSPPAWAPCTCPSEAVVVHEK